MKKNLSSLFGSAIAVPTWEKLEEAARNPSGVDDKSSFVMSQKAVTTKNVM